MSAPLRGRRANPAATAAIGGGGTASRPARSSATGVNYMTALWGIIDCGLLALVYGAGAIQSVLAADAGSQKMQEISAAVREGAQAYLKRQYATIGIVGIVIFLIVGYFQI